jgi:hypothetical protein
MREQLADEVADFRPRTALPVQQADSPGAERVRGEVRNTQARERHRGLSELPVLVSLGAIIQVAEAPGDSRG